MTKKTDLPSSLTQLKERIEQTKQRLVPPSSSAGMSSASPWGKLFTVGVDLVAGVLAGVAGGLFIDWIFGSSPWGLILFFLLGAAAGFLNVYRTLTREGR